MSEAREIELKLELDASAERFARRASKALGSPGEIAKRLSSVYFDTRKHALRKHGLSLRVRQDGERLVQTVKADGTSGGIFDRSEWESELPTEHPDPDLIGDPKARDRVKSGGALAPVFSTEISRTTWTVSEGGSTIEVALDEGKISAGDAESPVKEVELELKEGSPADLFSVARRLAGTGQLLIGASSKSERGYALLNGSGRSAVKAGKVSLSRKMSAGEAFQAIARSCLVHFRLNEAGALERRPESLHQARVAIRRLRSAMSLFRRITADEEVARITGELRSLSQILGEARNLDVYRARVIAPETGRDPEPGLAEFAARVEAERADAYGRVERKLTSKRFRLFTLDLAAWIETGPWLTSEPVAEHRDEAVWRFANATLDRRRRRVKAKGRRLGKLDPDTRHRVRIDAKKLRYASEFFDLLVNGKKARRRHNAFLKALGEFQDCLGDLNDIETGHHLTRRLTGAEQPSGSGAGAGSYLETAGRLTGEQDARQQERLRSSMSAYKHLVTSKPFWR